MQECGFEHDRNLAHWVLEIQDHVHRHIGKADQQIEAGVVVEGGETAVVENLQWVDEEQVIDHKGIYKEWVVDHEEWVV